MEDLIYIVLGLLWLVFTFYTQSRKKKQREAQQGKAKTATQSSETPKSFFEQVFVEAPSPVEVEAEEHIPEAEMTQSEFFEERKARSTFEEEYEKMGIKSLEDKNYNSRKDEAGKSGKNNLVKKHGFEYGNDSDFGEIEGLEFDLKKAVIMAEILERPYS